MLRISSRTSGSYSLESACQSSTRSSLRRSISSWISRIVLMPLKTPDRAPAFRGTSSGKPELVEALLVQPEVVGELVEDGDPDLRLELGGVGKRVDERQPEDADPVGKRARPVAA